MSTRVTSSGRLGSFPESNPNRTEAQFCSIFSQLLQLFPRLEFEQAVRQHHAGRHLRGFNAVLSARPRREICGGLAATEGKLKHLGLSAAPKRSNANRQRPWQLFETVFQQLQVRQLGLTARGHKFRFKNRLLRMPASLVSVFDWAQFQAPKAPSSCTLSALVRRDQTHDLRWRASWESPACWCLHDYQWFVELSRPRCTL